MKHTRTINPGLFTGLWLLPVLALLQSGVGPHWAVRGLFPSVVLIAVVDWGILRGVEEGMLWAFLGGLALDVFSGWPFGTSALSLVVVASLVSLGQGTFMRTHALLPPLTVFLATVLYYLIALFILETLQQPVDWIAVLRGLAVPLAIFNAVVNLPLFWLMQRLEDRVYPVPRANW